jgi:hypothetical protein
VLAFRIGTVKNSKNFLRVDGPARAMIAGAGKECTETTANSESDIWRQCHFANYLAWNFAGYLAYSPSMDQLAGLTEEARKLALDRFRL